MQRADALGLVARALGGADEQPHGRERGAYLVRHVGQRVGQRVLLGVEALGGGAQGGHHLRQLVSEHGQIALAVVREGDAPAAVQHLVDLGRQTRDLPVAPQRERREQRAGQRAGGQHPQTRARSFHRGGRCGDDGKRPREQRQLAGEGPVPRQAHVTLPSGSPARAR